MDSEQSGYVPLQDVHWAAERLGLTTGRVYELARRRVIPCLRLGRQVRFDPRAIDAYIRAHGWQNTEEAAR